MNILTTLNKNKFDIIRFLFCGGLSYILLFVEKCRTMDNSGKSVKFRPPGYIFGIVWPILYILFGLSWVFSHKDIKGIWIDILYIILSIVIVSWILFYSCLSLKKVGPFVILLSICFTIIIMNIVELRGRLLLVPLLSWLLYALLMNTAEIQQSL
jgi:translocator protein